MQEMAWMLALVALVGAIGLVLWVVWQTGHALGDRTWVRLAARAVGIAFALFSGSLALAILSSYADEPDGGSRTTFAIGTLLIVSALLMGVGSIAPDRPMPNRVLRLGWGALIIALLLSGTLALLLPVAAAGAASFLWRPAAESGDHTGLSAPTES